MKLLVSLWLAVVACGLYARCARAEPVTFNCVELAVTMQNAAQLRDLDASLDKVLALGRLNSGAQGPRWAVLEREVRLVWASRKTPDKVGQDVYKRCRQQLGDMGREG